MDLSKIVSIAGKAGLSKVITQTKTNLIVESLMDGRKFPAFATYKISTLEDISIYTTDEDVPLKEIFKKIFKKEEGKPASVNPKGQKEELTGYFKEILPEYDEERVYPSDIKKVISWYNILVDKDILNLRALEEKKAKKEDKEADAGKEVETKATKEAPKEKKVAAEKKTVKKPKKAAPNKKSTTE